MESVIWKPLDSELRDWVYSTHDVNADRNNRLIGYVRGDFGRNGDEFWANWFGFHNELRTDEFNTQLRHVMDQLSKKEGLLHDRSTMRKLMRSGTYLEDGVCAFKIESGKYLFCLRCDSRPGCYNFYLYAYVNASLREWLDESMGAVDCYADIISYLPGVEKLNDKEHNPFGIWVSSDGYIFCHSEEEAETIADWLCKFDFLRLDPEMLNEFDESDDDRLRIGYAYLDTTEEDRAKMVDKSDSIFIVYPVWM